jgi:hypothetical protein
MFQMGTYRKNYELDVISYLEATVKSDWANINMARYKNNLKLSRYRHAAPKARGVT